ncbi:predicted protein [Naegleria gruberi]|uniref:Predicted protein n=1 Tax=Naegleria gruberi TaxID=5762 RepID=D2VEY4_NAEGR|nr:uncharacterized protein NAEGRDRAFT_79697 [Naegleria gruberi]EFC44682.1 predicted protein [Naegleria gruberi]|eukprot:XP_002677426.1 predicted protein [Naegleria gruberi strain NEG-M]
MSQTSSPSSGEENNASSEVVQQGQLTTPVRVRRFATIISNTSPMAGRFQKSSSNNSSPPDSNTANNNNNNNNNNTNNGKQDQQSPRVENSVSSSPVTITSQNNVQKVTWLSELAQEDQLLIPSAEFKCFKLSCPFIVVGTSKMKYQITMTVRNGKCSLSSHRRYSEVLKFHQRLAKVMKMTKELTNLFPAKVAFIIKNPEKRRKLGFEKYFDLLVMEIMTQLESSLSKDWIHQVVSIILEDLFDIQFVEDVINAMRRNGEKSNGFNNLIEDVASSINLSISLKQMHKSCISSSLSEHALLANVLLSESATKITTISELLLFESTQPKYLTTLFSSDYKKRDEYGGSYRLSEVDSIVDRDAQNTEYQILKLNLNRFGDRQSLDSILQSICSAIDVHVKTKNTMLRREIENLSRIDPAIKQLNEKGEKIRSEFLEEIFKDIYSTNTVSDNYPTYESEIQFIKKTLDSLASVSKQNKELEMKSSILFTQLLKAIQSHDKQLIQKTVEQITLKSQAIADVNEKLVEIVKSWLAYMDIHISKKNTEKDEVHKDFILLFLIPMIYSVISNKLGFSPSVMNLFFGLRSSSVTTEFELLSEKDLYIAPGPSHDPTSSPISSSSSNGEKSSANNSNNSTPTTPKKSSKKQNVFDEQLSICICEKVVDYAI